MARGTTKHRVEQARKVLDSSAVRQMERARQEREDQTNLCRYTGAMAAAMDVEAVLGSPSRRPTVEGRTIDGQGYAHIYMPFHPRAVNGRVREHVVVMERKIGRLLFAGENVHHRNGVRDDNHPENLELWAKPQPTGIRAEDAVAHAVETLRRYAPHLLRDN